MFENNFFEFFSRIPPWQPPAIFVPVILWSLYSSFTAEVSALAIVACFVAGVLHWTLMEYLFHRFVFHYEADSKFGKRLIWIFHGVHHDWPNDKLRLVFPPILTIPLAVIFWALYSKVFGDNFRYPVFAGLISGYLTYDMMHYYVHHFAPKNRVAKYLRAYHLAHHHKHEPTRYGVSSPLWDYVFGTQPKPGA